MTITHRDFTLTRTYPYSPAEVFDAFADPEKKKLWFGANDGFTNESESWDFRVGGREQASSRHESGWRSSFDATYADIVPGERIVFSYVMTFNGEPLSASATCITFEPVEGGTLLTHSEHGIHLDEGPDAELREQGTEELLDNLGRALDSLAVR